MGWSNYTEDHIGKPEMGCLMLTVVPLFFGVLMSTSLMEALQIWIAPKIWLIEYASDLVK